MAQPHLGNRIQLRFHAPKALVDRLCAYADARGLPLSRTTSDLLSIAAGHPNLTLCKDVLFDVDELTAQISDSDPTDPTEIAILKFRAPSCVVHTLDRIAGKEGSKRHVVAIRLLSEAVGLPTSVNEGRQLQMTG